MVLKSIRIYVLVPLVYEMTRTLFLVNSSLLLFSFALIMEQKGVFRI